MIYLSAPEPTPAPSYEMLPTVVGPRGRLNEREVRIAGLMSTMLITLRAMGHKASAGAKLQTAGGTIALSQNDAEAVIALLIERGENLLINLDIQIDREGQ